MELTEQLQSLLGEADRRAGMLEEKIREAKQCVDVPAHAVEKLQERLRLGARMLKAFQVQIDSLSGTLAEFDDRRDRINASEARVDELLAAIDEAGEKASGRLDERLQSQFESIIKRIDEHIEARRAEARPSEAFESRMAALEQAAIRRIDAHINHQLDRLGSVDQRIAELERQMGDAVQAVEESEQRLASSAERTTSASRAIETRLDELARLTSRSDEIRSVLSNVLLEAERDCDRLTSDFSRLGSAVRVDVERCGELQQDISRSVGDLSRLAGQLGPAMDACERLEAMLEQLRPWKRLLIDERTDADALPRPVAELLGRLRSEIGTDMSVLSATLRSLAERIDDFELPSRDPRCADAASEDDRAPEIVIPRDRGADADPKQPSLRFRDHVENG